jgi:DNA-binding NarL/FixJ family response regulator
MFTIHEDERLIEESLRAGARGYVLKSDLTGQLIQAVRSLSEHKPFFTSTVSETLLSSMLTAQIEDGIRLSYEERTVVRLFAQGHKNRELADILNMSLKRVENRRTTIMRKLKLPSSAALVLYAIRNRLVEP